MNKLKITIKFNVNFLSIILKYTLYLTMPVFWKSCRHYYIPLLQQECRFTILRKILLSKSVWRRFSIIKLFLKISENSQKTIWNWSCWLKRDSGAGAFLHNLRGVFRTKSNIYDKAFSHCIFAEMLHYRYLARV